MPINIFEALACFEFTKYSSCFSAMNVLKANLNITVIEASPTPSGGILILGLNSSSEKPENFNLFYQAQLGFNKDSLLKSCLILKPNPQVLSAYLSQNSIPQINDLSFFETNSICDGLSKACDLAESGASLIDFRTLRSTHNRCIVVFTSNDRQIYSENITTISNPADLIKSYFQILK